MGEFIDILDHGRSAVFVIDAADLDHFLGQLEQIETVSYETFVPGNAQYQPGWTPWGPDTRPIQALGLTSPAGGDFLHVEVYEIDETSVGIWLYSD